MTSFSAVTTTGIYCRPDCSARPDPRNLQQFDSAAAAEAAGYRACLRCRPYRAHQPLGVVGPDLVCRGVRLVVDGALDDGNESELARRLGVSARHLRRLFMDHVGVTPDQLARSRRAHFARRLLDETDLSVTEVAFASGFGSVRQLHRVFAEVFRASPGELRARRRRADRLVADGGLALRLAFTPPLAWDTMLDYFAARSITGVEHVADGTYRRTVLIEGDPGVIEISAGGPEHLLLRVHLPHWAGLIHLVQRARGIFNLEVDVAAADQHLATDPTLSGLVAARPGSRPPGTWDPFEIGVRAIVGQQVSVAGATTIMARLVQRHGTPVPGLAQLGLTHLFPGPEVLAEGDLGGLGLPGARAQAIATFARAVEAGTLPLDRSASLSDLVDRLTALPGIGAWTANYLAVRLGEPDAFPVTDLGLRRAYSRLTGATDPGSLAGAAERWRPWRAHAAAHLWLAEARPHESATVDPAPGPGES